MAEKPPGGNFEQQPQKIVLRLNSIRFFSLSPLFHVIVTPDDFFRVSPPIVSGNDKPASFTSLTDDIVRSCRCRRRWRRRRRCRCRQASFMTSHTQKTNEPSRVTHEWFRCLDGVLGSSLRVTLLQSSYNKLNRLSEREFVRARNRERERERERERKRDTTNFQGLIFSWDIYSRGLVQICFLIPKNFPNAFPAKTEGSKKARNFKFQRKS